MNLTELWAGAGIMRGWNMLMADRYDKDYQNAKSLWIGLQNIVFIAIAVVVCYLLFSASPVNDFTIARAYTRNQVFTLRWVFQRNSMLQYLLEVLS